jgi:hypothetical protein
MTLQNGAGGNRTHHAGQHAVRKLMVSHTPVAPSRDQTQSHGPPALSRSAKKAAADSIPPGRSSSDTSEPGILPGVTRAGPNLSATVSGRIPSRKGQK